MIPARYGSSRFPGKVLARDTGRTLIEHVHERAALAAGVDAVVVATDDERVREAVESFGGRVVMTSPDHPNGTSRIAEAVADLAADVVVNVQGDEPELDPELIDRAIEALAQDRDCVMSTVASPFAAGEDPADPNIVKVVVDRRARALYFSRALVPHRRADMDDAAAPLKHVGLYAYRRAFLGAYVRLPETPLERTECLEQLRVLEHGHAIAVAVAEAHHHGIDTEEQYRAFVARCRSGA